MHSADWNRIQKLFEEARQLRAEERPGFLEKACARDAALRDEVESLLGHLDQAPPEFMQTYAGVQSSEISGWNIQSRGSTGAQKASQAVPEWVATYKIIREIGRGGFGVVYEAEQEHPRRPVALKVIRFGVPSAQALRRLEQEAEILGRLEHAGIARIYEAGVHDAGVGVQPFFAMEYIRGQPLTEYAATHKLGTRERLRILVQVCQAVHHAHQRGIIHRDLKPGNILVTDDGQPKVLDFGVARATDSDIQASTLRTDIGQLIGTIPYMSPEQAGGDPNDLDVRSDVYALGVVAYELLAGRLPYDLANKMVHEAVRVIREDDPTPLSSVDRALRGDVEIIVGKALAKEKERRYQSATELCTDIERYLRNEPIAARPPSTWYQLSRFARRNRALVGGLAATFVVLMAGLIGTTSFAAREAEQRHLAEQERNRARLEAERAQKAEADTQQRAMELEQVAEFQASQLAEIDTAQMGIRLRNKVIASRRTALKDGSRKTGEVEAGIKELTSSLAGVNFTDIALDAINESVFERALATIDKSFVDQPLVKARLLQSLAKTLRELGLLERATNPQMVALQIRRDMLGEEHRDTLTSANEMGLLLAAQGNYSESERLLRQVMMIRRRILGDRHDDSLTSSNNLGGLYWLQGKYAEAESYWRDVLEVRRQTLGNDHPDTLESIDNMGALLQALGKYSEAESYSREAVSGRRRILGNTHTQTLISILNMGSLVQAQGRYEEAESLFREALDGFRRTLGEDHPTTLAATSILGGLFHDDGRLAEAEEFYHTVLEGQSRILGDAHPDTLQSVNNMGVLLRSVGRLAEAEVYYRKALEGFRRVLGADHRDTLTSLYNMGDVLCAQGKLVEAEPYYRESLEVRRRVLGDDHPDTLVSMNGLALLLKLQGRHSEAIPYFQAALVGFRRTQGNDHPDTLLSISDFGSLLVSLGKLDEAEPYFREALEKQRRVLGDEHPNTLVSIGNMGALLCAQGKPTEAIALLARVEPVARRVFTDSNAAPLGRLLTNLGRSHAGTAEFDAAEADLSEAHAILSEVKGVTDQDRAALLTGLVELYDGWHAAQPEAVASDGTPVEQKAVDWRAKFDAWHATTQPAARDPASMPSPKQPSD